MVIQKDVQVYGTILISSENKILLVRGRRTGKWSFPKGHPNKYESYHDCARRETFEETGIEIPDILNENLRLATGIYFIHRVNGQPQGIPIDTKEVMDIKWWTVHQIQRLSVNIDVSYFLKHHNNFLWQSCNNTIHSCHNNSCNVISCHINGTNSNKCYDDINVSPELLVDDCISQA